MHLLVKCMMHLKYTSITSVSKKTSQFLFHQTMPQQWIKLNGFKGELRVIHSPCQVVGNKMPPFVAKGDKELGSFQCKGSLEDSL